MRGSGSARRGIAQLITGGQILTIYYPPFAYLGNGFLAGLPFATSIHWTWQFQSWKDVLPAILVVPAIRMGSHAMR